MLALKPSNWFPNNFEVHRKLSNRGTQNYSAKCLDLFKDRKELDCTGMDRSLVSKWPKSHLAGPRATWQPWMV